MFGFGKRFIKQVGKDIEAQEIERKKCADIQRKQYEEYIIMLDAEYKRREHNIVEAIGFVQKCYNENVGKDAEAIVTDLDRMDYGYNRDIKTWNEAIEAAASMLQLSYPDNTNTNAFCAAIRGMKK